MITDMMELGGIWKPAVGRLVGMLKSVGMSLASAA
jgi:hypothetical protein